jgi:uncharacterized repeat protein (TIGR02543 family)
LYTEAGVKIDYAVREDAVTGYNTEYSVNESANGWEFYITNTLQYFTVTFVDFNGEVILQTQVPYGGSVTPPGGPGRTNYTFNGWTGGSWDNVTADQIIRATYNLIAVPTIITELGIPLAGGTVANVGDTFD